MKLSTVTRYSLLALSDMCAREDDGESGPVTVGDIARRLDISLSYLKQLFARLRRGQVVKSVRGVQGGYVLARPAGEVTVADIIRALGEPISFGDCQDGAGCGSAAECPAYGLLRRLKTSVDGILESTTLEDLAKGDKQKNIAQDGRVRNAS